MKNVKILFIFFIVFLCNIPSSQTKESLHSSSPKNLKFKVKIHLGQENGDSPTTFFRIEDIAIDSKNNFFILDTQRPAIICFNANGKFIKTIDLTKGRGPGEVLSPRELEVNSDDELVLLDTKLRRLYKFNLTTNSRKTVNLPNDYPLQSGENLKVDNEGNYWIIHKDLKKHRVLHIYNSKGDYQKSCIVIKPMEIGATYPIPFRGFFDWFRDKIIFLKETPYEIIIYDYNGSEISKFYSDESFMKPPKAIQRGGGFILPAWDKTEFIGNISDKYVLTKVFAFSKKLARFDLFDIKTGELIASCNYSSDEAFDIFAVKDEKIYAMTESKNFPEVLVLEFRY